MERAAPALATPEPPAIDGPFAAASASASASTAFEHVTASTATPITRAHALFVLRRDAAALPHAREAIAAEPQRADAWTLLGILEHRTGRLAQAEAAYREALRLQPDYADAWINFGNLLRDRNDRRGTLLAFLQAMRLAPGRPEPAYNLGVALEHFGDAGGALAAFEATLECDPHYVDAHWNRALALLRLERFEEGFRAYEWRFRRGLPGPRQCVEPIWDGRPLNGRTILVWAEQGFGDALQFLRFVPEVARRGGRVVLEVLDGMTTLASRIPGVAAVTARGASPPPFDTHVALMSLPFTLGTTAGELAPREPYLRADPVAASHWRARLQQHGWQRERELAIGLVWAGNPALRNARERSPGLATLRGLLDAPRLRWFALQKGGGRDDLTGADLPANFVDLDAGIETFDDTAAVVANLDIVVTCDTAVAHLAGAMGKPTFVMLPFAPDWRYASSPCTTPWYPAMRLFRQATRDDWTTVLGDVAAALAKAVTATLPRGWQSDDSGAKMAPCTALTTA